MPSVASSSTSSTMTAGVGADAGQPALVTAQSCDYSAKAGNSAQLVHQPDRDPALPAFRARSIFGVYGDGGDDEWCHSPSRDLRDDGSVADVKLFLRGMEYGDSDDDDGGDATQNWPAEVSPLQEADDIDIELDEDGQEKASDAADDDDVREVQSGEGPVYDNVYFDSDDEGVEEGAEQESHATQNKTLEGRHRDRRRKQTDADMLFDPKSDDADEAWIARKLQEHSLTSIAKRRGQRFLASGGRFSPDTSRRLRERQAGGNRFDALESEMKKMHLSGERGVASDGPLVAVDLKQGAARRNSATTVKEEEEDRNRSHTDAVLTCPLCFTYLCYDCQQHTMYSSQFRAMFTENCRTVYTERFLTSTGAVPVALECSKRQNDSSLAASGTAVDYFYPVYCKVCNTQVAVRDQSSVVHFFNVIAQEP